MNSKMLVSSKNVYKFKTFSLNPKMTANSKMFMNFKNAREDEISSVISINMQFSKKFSTFKTNVHEFGKDGHKFSNFFSNSNFFPKFT